MGMRRKRFWSNEEKRGICTEAMPPGMSVAQVPRCKSPDDRVILQQPRVKLILDGL